MCKYVFQSVGVCVYTNCAFFRFVCVCLSVVVIIFSATCFINKIGLKALQGQKEKKWATQ